MLHRFFTRVYDATGGDDSGFAPMDCMRVEYILLSLN